MAKQKSKTTKKSSGKTQVKWWEKLPYKKIGIGVAVSFPILLTLFYFSIWVGISGKLPTKAVLKNIQHPLASAIYDAEGILLGKYFIENRSETTFEELPDFLVRALIATEDTRFYKHNGVDIRSTLRVLFKTVLLMDRSSGGGSTITQQLAKNLFPRQRFWFASTFVNKTREIIVAQRIEKVYSKEEILTLYLNTVPFGENVFGVGVASERFFDRDPAQLLPEESATLVGMLKATTYYSPRKNPEGSKARRNVVFDQMEKYAYVTSEEAVNLREKPLELRYAKRTDIEGPGMYFRAQLKNELKQWCKDHLNEQEEPYNLYTDGLKIYTTLDATLQKYAEESVAETLHTLQEKFDSQLKTWKPFYGALEDATLRSTRYKVLKKQGLSYDSIQTIFATPMPNRIYKDGNIEAVEISPIDSIKHYLKILQGAIYAMDPQSGAIKAWVGGIDHQHFGIDYVTTPRQSGSTFKPFVYGAALEQGFDPCWYYDNELRTYENYKGWTPKNSNNEYVGSYTMKGALTNSVNTVSVQVLFDAGIENVIDFAQRAGITSTIPEVPSIALGTAEVSLQEMVNAYCTIANRGIHSKPFYLLRIEDRFGNVLEDFSEKLQADIVLDHMEIAFDDTTATELLHLMESVVNAGTAKRLRSQYGFKFDIAGKTGTTQNQSDGWFIGITPNLVAGAWVGANDRRIHFQSISDGQGARTALPIWASFFEKINANSKYKSMLNQSFKPVATFASIEDFECDSYSELTADEMNSRSLEEEILDDIADVFRSKNKKERIIKKQRSSGLNGILESIFGKKEDKDKRRRTKRRN